MCEMRNVVIDREHCLNRSSAEAIVPFTDQIEMIARLRDVSNIHQIKASRREMMPGS